jgi:hypothetical protein
MFCMRCGQDVPETAQFCASCGQPARLPVTPSPAASYGAAPPPPQQTGVSTPETAQENLKGVAGWLLFFCIGFTVLWPLWVLGQYAFYSIGFRLIGVLGLLRMVFGIVVGVFLWTGNRAALVLLRVYFVISALLLAWSIYNVGTFMLRYHAMSGILMSWTRSQAPYVLFLVLGIAYFAMSERVRATFGENLW